MEVSVHEAYEALAQDGHCLLDVRTMEEVAESSVPGSLHIPLDRLEAELYQLAPYASVHVMCRSGGRSSIAVAMLHCAGMTQAKSVSGGIMLWGAAGLPVSR